MSKKAPANPLLIRHRYLNPFPPPPFPPKLLHIPTDPARYAGYRFLTHLENEREIPVLADADLGMPIELGLESDGSYGLGTYWEGDRSVVCPDLSVGRQSLDAEDLALLSEPPPPPGASISITNGISQTLSTTLPASHHGSTSSSGPPLSTPTPLSDRRKTEVSWLRRTEYFNEVQHKSRDSVNNQKSRAQIPIVPKTKTERLAEIHASFDIVANYPIEKLKHPTKPHLKAVQTFEFLPNQSIWANTYDLYRFQENPTDRNDPSSLAPNFVDPRLEHAILRPVPVRGDTSRLAYYLPDSAEGALNYKKTKLEKRMIDDEAEDAPEDAGKEKAEGEEPTHELHFVREYEISQYRTLNQYLVVFDDGSDSGGKKAVYFNPIFQFRTLRKRRPKPHEHHLEDVEGNPLWDGISVILSTNAQALEQTKANRKELLAGVSEPPAWLQS